MRNAAAASGDWRGSEEGGSEEAFFEEASFGFRFVVVVVAAAASAAASAASASPLTLAATRLASDANASASPSQPSSCSSLALSSSSKEVVPRGSGKKEASGAEVGGAGPAVLSSPVRLLGSLLPPSRSASTASPTARASLLPLPPRAHDSTLGQETRPDVESTQVWRSSDGDDEEDEEEEGPEELRFVSESVGGAEGNEAGRAIRKAEAIPPGSLKGSWNKVASLLSVSVVGWRRRSSSTWEARLFFFLREGGGF